MDCHEHRIKISFWKQLESLFAVLYFLYFRDTPKNWLHFYTDTELELHHHFFSADFVTKNSGSSRHLSELSRLAQDQQVECRQVNSFLGGLYLKKETLFLCGTFSIRHQEAHRIVPCSNWQRNETPGDMLYNLLTFLEKFSINLWYQPDRPRNLWTSLTDAGTGNDWTADIFPRSVLTPSAEMTWPRNVSDGLMKLHFFKLRDKPEFED